MGAFSTGHCQELRSFYLKAKVQTGKHFFLCLPQFEQFGRRALIQMPVLVYLQWLQQACFWQVLQTRTELGTVFTVEMEYASGRKNATYLAFFLISNMALI